MVVKTTNLICAQGDAVRCTCLIKGDYMDYNKVIDLDGITLEDCERFYEKGKRLIVNDGRVVHIVEED